MLPNGPETIVQVSRGSTTIIARVSQSTEIEEGWRLGLRFNLDALNVYDAGTGRIIDRAGVPASDDVLRLAVKGHA